MKQQNVGTSWRPSILRNLGVLLVLIGVPLLATQGFAQTGDIFVYPAKGQSAGQQSKDDTECYAWAKQYTGIDPVRVASTPPPR